MNKRIRLLQLIYSFDVEGSGGGLSRFVFALSKALDPENFDVTICGLWNTGTGTEQDHIKYLNSHGVRALTATDWNNQHPAKSLWSSYLAIRNFIRQSPVDIIHSHSEFSDITALLLKFNPGVPVIIRTLHNGFKLEWRKRYIRRVLLSYILCPIFFDAEIGVASHIVANMDRRWLTKLVGHKGSLLHNAIEVDKFRDLNSQTNQPNLGLGIPRGAFVVGTVGRLREEKGYETLLEAVAQVIHQTDNPIRLLIIGTGELQEQLKALTQNLQIVDQVIFTGPRANVEFLLPGMDLFVSSSLWEGFSTAVLEAMAAGTPVLVTDIPGNRELVKPGIDGWMVKPGDPTAMAEEILKIINLPIEIRQGIAQEARKVPAIYSIDAVAEEHQRMYKELIKKKRG